MKRIFDFILSVFGLLVLSPILIIVILIVWMQDWHSPFYIALRVGEDGKLFNMVKLRSMIINAHRSGIDSTSDDDQRITFIGHFVRRFKIDEVTQLWNVVIGNMSLVGPRPNVKRETDLYTKEEMLLLSVKPGITDFSSIVFSDLGDILKNYDDPDIAYNQLIRPWKSRLGIYYIKNRTLILDLKLIFITMISIISKQKALNSINKILTVLSADDKLIEISKRKNKLTPFPPPGLDFIVKSR